MKHEHKPAHEHHDGEGRTHDGHTHDHRRIAGRRLVACIVITGLMMLAEAAGGVITVARTEEIRKTAAAEMADEFNIGHIVLQFETGVPA